MGKGITAEVPLWWILFFLWGGFAAWIIVTAQRLDKDVDEDKPWIRSLYAMAGVMTFFALLALWRAIVWLHRRITGKTFVNQYSNKPQNQQSQQIEMQNMNNQNNQNNPQTMKHQVEISLNPRN